MPTVTITLSDTPSGGVSIHTSFAPAVGAPCSPAQAAALEIMQRTRRDWGLSAPLLKEVDIDAVHRTRDASRAFCTCDLEPTIQEADTGRCMACGKVMA